MTNDLPHDSRGRPPVLVPRDGPLRPPMRRFYATADLSEPAADGSIALLLDGRRARTPGKAFLQVSSRAFGSAIVAEWMAQGATVDPLTMPLTRLVNTAIDGVAPNAAAVRADLIAYSGSDLVCYRASHPAALQVRQREAWAPVVDWAAGRFGVALLVVDGIMPVTQPPALAVAVGRAVARIDPIRLAALHLMTTLTGSFALAFGVVERAWSVETAWTAANVDEDWQVSQWGADEEAIVRRRGREGDMRAAARLLDLLDDERADTPPHDSPSC